MYNTCFYPKHLIISFNCISQLHRYLQSIQTTLEKLLLMRKEISPYTYLLVGLDTLQMFTTGMESSMISLLSSIALTPTLKLNTSMQSSKIKHYYCWVAGITTELSLGWTLVKFIVDPTSDVLQNNGKRSAPQHPVSSQSFPCAVSAGAGS